jgi:MFS family permease
MYRGAGGVGAIMVRASEERRVTSQNVTAREPLGVDERVMDAVISAYYPRVVAIGETARNRAQAAFAGASALAGGALGAFVVTLPRSQHPAARLLGCLAVGAWLLAVPFFVAAIARYVRPVQQSSNQDSRSDDDFSRVFLREVFQRSAEERKKVDKLQQIAQLIACVALVLSFFTFVAATFAPEQTEKSPASLVLTPAGQGALADLCHHNDRIVDGRIESASLGTPFVVFHVDANTCGGYSAILRIPRSDVAVVRVQDS